MLVILVDSTGLAGRGAMYLNDFKREHANIQ
jgi:hypothetical protein